MRLTRVVHAGAAVFYGPARELIPDVAEVGDTTGADQCLLFLDSDGAEAHAFFFTEERARELARTILGIEIARVVPTVAPSANGDSAR